MRPADDFAFLPGNIRQEQDFEKDKNIMLCPGQDPEEVRGQLGQADGTECRCSSGELASGVKNRTW